MSLALSLLKQQMTINMSLYRSSGKVQYQGQCTRRRFCWPSICLSIKSKNEITKVNNHTKTNRYFTMVGYVAGFC